MVQNAKLFHRRQSRVRFKVKKVNHSNRPRLSVFRSNRYIYVQLIDDLNQKTLAFASSFEKDLQKTLKSSSNQEAAQVVGKRIAERAIQQGVKEVVFDRGGYLFHGRVKALAEAARTAGLSF